MKKVDTQILLDDMEVVPKEHFRDAFRKSYKPSGSKRLESLRRKYLRVAVYACFGADELFQATSVELLKQPFEALLRNTPAWTPRGYFIDQTGRDAVISKRPMFNRMFDDGAFDLIICKSISHLHTNLAMALDAVTVLNRCGIPIYFEVEDVYSGNPSDMRNLRVMAMPDDPALTNGQKAVERGKICEKGKPCCRV